tara:strand:+ start:522 stop:1733 length:1212 start_codon:yes stop_codon:yes gene_type:complete
MIKRVLPFILSMSISPNMVAKASDESITKNELKIGSTYTFKSLGAVRFEEGEFGVSRLAYTDGAIAVSSTDNIVYVAGHDRHFSVGGFLLNKKPKHDSVSSLPIMPNILPFTKVDPKYRETKTANVITGLEVIDNELLVTTDEYYDADHNNKEHLVIFKNRLDLEKSEQDGFFTMTGGSHSAGWMSKIPAPLSDELDALYLAGSASNLPINSRHSIGPSLFTWFPFFLSGTKGESNIITTEALIDYSLNYPLHDDSKNETKKNELWTELSTAVYGFISPDQRNYIVLGTSGGHKSEIGYKITRKNGKKCGGFCAMDPTDYYNYYWIYSVEDIKESFSKRNMPETLRPTQYGKLELFDHKYPIIGADYDRESQKLYLMLKNLDSSQNSWESQPLLVIYEYADTK